MHIYLMEEKKITWRNFALCSISCFGHIYKSLLGRVYNWKNNRGFIQYQNGAGFTLVELVIVIAVIGVLATSLIVLVNPISQLQKSRDATRKSDLSQIRSALELYRADIGSYPLQTTVTDPPSGQFSPEGNINCGAVPFKGSGSNTYMRKIPCDPLPEGGVPKYRYESESSSYNLWACLENINDKDRDGDNQSAADKCADSTGQPKRVSYTLQNP